jgi:hypothetical protein
MNKYLEYLSLVPKGIPNITSIIDGVMNSVELEHNTLPEQFKKEIIRRRVICETCPFNNINAKTSEEYFKLTGKHYSSNRKKSHCSICGCPLSIRTASLNSNCGIEEWNNNNDNKIPLKWTAYNEKTNNVNKNTP